MTGAPATRVLVHADESCLGNGTEPPNPGGNAALVEAPAGDSVARWDLYECSPDTTNQKMALAGGGPAPRRAPRPWENAPAAPPSRPASPRQGKTGKGSRERDGARLDYP